MNVLKGRRPDITAAQIVSGVPIICTMLAAFGLWEPTEEQKDALTAAVVWAVALVFGDSALRIGRGLAASRATPEEEAGDLDADEAMIEAETATVPDAPGG
jgi:hypothetical protein